MPMQNLFEYDIFLSFASLDKELVKPVWQEMSLSGLRVFWSDESLKQNIGQSFFGIIQNALTQSKHFVLYCTPNAMQSNWVKEEYETFFSECYIRSGRTRRIVLFSGKNFDRSLLPSLLRNIQMAQSVKEIILTLGGIDIQALKNENIALKHRLEMTNSEVNSLKERLTLLINENTHLKNKIEMLNSENQNLLQELVKFQNENSKPKSNPIPEEKIDQTNVSGRDPLFDEALKLVVRHQQGSISLLQRRLKIEYSRAARLIDELEAAGIVGGFDGSKAREVLVDESYLEKLQLE